MSSDRHELAVFRQVRRHEVVQCLVHQHGDLELNTLADWKLLQDGRDVLSPSRVGDEACCGVLNGL